MPVPSPRHPSLARRALPRLTLAGAGGLLLLELDHPAPLGEARAGAQVEQRSRWVTPARRRVGPSRARSLPRCRPSPSSAAPQSCGTDETGPAVQTRFGPVQVEALVSADGKVCDVQAIQSPGGERRSIAINADALPILHDRAVQSGDTFDAVTGATVTSDGYRASLQAILDGG